MAKLFGTDGIRGVAGEYPLDPSTLFRLGQSLVELGKKNIVVGRDTRASGVWIERVLQKAVQSRGGQTHNSGILPTPGVAYLSRLGPFDAGLVISASHNPFRDNGIKVFSGEGRKLSDQQEAEIERNLLNGRRDGTFQSETITDEGSVTHSNPDLCRPFENFLKKIPAEGSLNSLKVVLDCANGAAFGIAPQIFKELGATVTAISDQPDGSNINRDCGALHPARMAETVVQSGASLGVAFDGDADRAIFADELGNLVDGDYVLYILARHLHKLGKLPSGTVVTTIMANLGLAVALEREGLQMVRTSVGDRYVLESMLAGGYELGGEQSGHVIIGEHSLAGDGILTALKICEILGVTGLSLSQLARGLEKFPQVLLNVRVREKKDFKDFPEIIKEIHHVEQSLGNRGRVVIRYSGTEPLVRVMVEGEQQHEIDGYARTIARQFEQVLGN